MHWIQHCVAPRSISSGLNVMLALLPVVLGAMKEGSEEVNVLRSMNKGTVMGGMAPQRRVVILC